MDIYVGSLPFKLKENQLTALFEPYGEVASVKIIIHKITRQNKGFGFVTMPNDEQALAAIKALNGFDLEGRELEVSKSDPKVEIKSTGKDVYKASTARKIIKNVPRKRNDDDDTFKFKKKY